MAKRGRPSNDQLTGGSKDVNPQEFVIVAKQTGIDASTVVAQPLPIPRLPTKPGKNLVMELLWVQFFWLTPALPGVGSYNAIFPSLTTNGANPVFKQDVINDVRAISIWQQYIQCATAVGYAIPITFFEESLTDDAGHGILLATDTVYFRVFTTGTNVTNEITCRFGYRFKEVDLVEYIGIVQSQQ